MIDTQILNALQDQGRLAVSDLADQVGLSEAPTWRRLKRLEMSNIITGYHANLSRKGLGYTVFAIVSVRFAIHNLTMDEEFTTTICGLDCVQSCHNVTGDVDYILTVVTRDLEEYEHFTRMLRGIPGVTSIQTHLSLRELKSTNRLAVRLEDVNLV